MDTLEYLSKKARLDAADGLARKVLASTAPEAVHDAGRHMLDLIAIQRAGRRPEVATLRRMTEAADMVTDGIWPRPSRMRLAGLLRIMAGELLAEYAADGTKPVMALADPDAISITGEQAGQLRAAVGVLAVLAGLSGNPAQSAAAIADVSELMESMGLDPLAEPRPETLADLPRES